MVRRDGSAGETNDQTHREFTERLYSEHHQKLRAFLRRSVGGEADLQVLVMQVFLRMLRAQSPEMIRNPEAYLYTIARNLLIEIGLRDRRWFDRTSLHESNDYQVLDSLLRGLPVKCCAVSVLLYIHGLNYQETAKKLGVSEHTVKKCRTMTLLHLRRQVELLKPRQDRPRPYPPGGIEDPELGWPTVAERFLKGLTEIKVVAFPTDRASPSEAPLLQQDLSNPFSGWPPLWVSVVFLVVQVAACCTLATVT
jgi:RNA polymerase sigma-70 factor (ECF subfamily)